MSKTALFFLIVIVGIGLGISSPVRAEDASQSLTSHGLTVYFGIVPAEIARGVARSHGDANMHGAQPPPAASYHLIVAIFNAVTGNRITDATVTASVTRPGFETPSKPMEPMKIVGTISYGNVFQLPGNGVYHIRLSIIRKGNSRPTELDLSYDHGHP
jgi:hypothetical protein